MASPSRLTRLRTATLLAALGVVLMPLISTTPRAASSVAVRRRVNREGEAMTVSINQRVRQDVHIYLNAIGDFVSAAAAATRSMGGIVEPVLRVDHAEPAVNCHALERLRRARFSGELADFVDRVE